MNNRMIQNPSKIQMAEIIVQYIAEFGHAIYWIEAFRSRLPLSIPAHNESLKGTLTLADLHFIFTFVCKISVKTPFIACFSMYLLSVYNTK